MTEKPRLGTYTEKKVIEKFKIIAKKNSRSMSQMIEYLVKREIEEYEKENGEIKIQI